jgi:hypothetical protein
MIRLDSHTASIEEFIQGSIDKFKAGNGIPSSIGVYCCPWAGWLTANFNLNKTLTETNNNCPDFEFVEFDLHELPDWQEEYESENPTYILRGVTTKHQPEDGDEKLNELIFNYLKPIIAKLKENNKGEFLLQMLDSNCMTVLM